jgi:hypothetical protein
MAHPALAALSGQPVENWSYSYTANQTACEGFTFWVARAKAWAPVTVVVEVVVVVVVDVLIDVAWALCR